MRVSRRLRIAILNPGKLVLASPYRLNEGKEDGVHEAAFEKRPYPE